jgi:hypothetical protein
VATWDDVRRLALELPETEESTAYGERCIKVAGKTFVNLSPHEEGALVVRAEHEEKPLLLAARPDVYWQTPHYEGYRTLLVRLEAIDEDELRDRLLESWLMYAPRRLVRQLETSASESASDWA